MTEALRDWAPPPEDQMPPSLAIYQPEHGPIWVATLPNWRNRAFVGSAATVAIAIALRGVSLLRPQTQYG
jgi:hypothetical protein